MAAGPGEVTQDGCRGIAFFLAFDPWRTCWRFPPGSARYFDAAEKNSLLSSGDARAMSQALLQYGVEISSIYTGAFSSYFSEPHIRNILGHIGDLDLLSESGLAIGGSWADRFFDSCPWPLVPDIHLEMQSFRQVVMTGEIDFYSETPWLAWIEALDLMCIGPWIGLKPPEIIQMVEALRQRTTGHVARQVSLADNFLGSKVIIPIFSRGLQGVVLGIFRDVPKTKREPILTSLLQFGETLGDVYADMRASDLLSVLDSTMDCDALARELLNVVSPVRKIIVKREGNRSGYGLDYEKLYFAGYHLLKTEELDSAPARESFSLKGPFGSTILIEPLADTANFAHDFVRTRLESCLERALVSSFPSSEALSLADIQEMYQEYRAYAGEDGSSLAKVRQYYVIQKIERNWETGRVKVSNSETKRFLEEELRRKVKNGYQITSFSTEIEKLFGSRVTVSKTRNALSLAWRPKG